MTDGAGQWLRTTRPLSRARESSPTARARTPAASCRRRKLRGLPVPPPSMRWGTIARSRLRFPRTILELQPEYGDAPPDFGTDRATTPPVSPAHSGDHVIPDRTGSTDISTNAPEFAVSGA